MIERRISEKKVAKVERDTPRTCATVGGSVGRNTASGLIHPVSSHSFECDNPENLRHACTKVVMMVGREESPVILKMCRHIRVTFELMPVCPCPRCIFRLFISEGYSVQTYHP